MATAKERHGHLISESALNAGGYDIPTVTFRRRSYLAVIPLAVAIGGSLILHRTRLGGAILDNPGMLAAWLMSIGFVAVQFLLSWNQRPFTLTPAQAAEVESCKVAVVVPCWNEDAAILDRTIFSLFRQTRLPDYVVVVDDGSTEADYRLIRTWWSENHPEGSSFLWLAVEHAGKKHAQAAGFRAVPDADVYATIDSDSALDSEAIAEGLKPFANPAVVSVAGLETAFNYRTNLLTRAISMRSLAFQLFAMSAQSVAGGNVIINPGSYSLYRGWLIRKIIPAYLSETFFGTPVTLGDDTALTLFALTHGKAVHQPTAVSMTVYPEKLSHHLRQWTRWMRASTIRTFWRFKYLPVRSYGWWYVVYQQWAFFISVAVSAAIPAAWPASKNIAIAGGIALLVWPLAVAVRLSTVKRSDMGSLGKLAGIAMLPLAALWYLVVLRQIRFYGMATCYRQGWVTRNKVEVSVGEQV